LRVAVTGASGFIGGHLTDALTARGDTVIPVKRPYNADALGVTLGGADVVVHLGGIVSAVQERDFYAANVDATRVVAQACRDAGARIVHVSSLAAAGPAPASAPRSEDDAAAPITTYGRSKLEGEQAVRSLPGLRSTVLRPGVVYGPRDRAVLPLVRYAMRGVLPLVGRAGAAYTFIYVGDLVRTLVAAIDADPVSRPIFVGHATPVTTRRLFDAIRAATGRSAATVPIPLWLMRIAALFGDVAGSVSGRPAVINSRRYAELASEGFVCRVDRMRETLRIVAQIDLPEGLNETVAWYRAEGWI
jgi:nucleoside-diphosphate-sugar epimerase